MGHWQLPAAPPPWRRVGNEYHLDALGLVVQAAEPRPRGWRVGRGWWTWAWYRHGVQQASTTAGPAACLDWATRSAVRDQRNAARAHERAARAARKLAAQLEDARQQAAA